MILLPINLSFGNKNDLRKNERKQAPSRKENDPTRSHKIPKKWNRFSQVLIFSFSVFVISPPPPLPAFGRNGLVERVKGRRPRQCRGRDQDVRADVDGQTSRAAAKETYRSLVARRSVLGRGGLEHGRLSGITFSRNFY